MRSAIFSLTIGAVFFAMAAAARAQPVNGFYVSGALGATFPHDRSSVTTPAAPELTPAPLPSRPPVSGAGTAGQGSVGYGLGNGLRFELGGNASTNRLRLPQ